MKQILLAALTCIPILSQAADEARNITLQGNKQGAPACQSCHGTDGGGTPSAGIPRLAGLNAAYIEQQLKNFRAGKRSNPIMQPIADLLTETEVTQVAAYYAALPVPLTTPQGADPALLRKGEAIATVGDWSHEIPACFQCHGPNGKGIAPHFPAIAGQSALYISNQIEAWKSGTRSNDPAGLMKSVADKLSPEQIEAVSAYLADQQSTNGNQK
ncbi:c-type cytochrome [Sideroxydans lithotrophicus]|uniref:Cytochrome c class I n=1 Tax=Sideroxydans lithotrophicus (strain ES-1) TaxID=580332 RepID=D5CT20_SIDLE|nr:c-type cytochrome [Sideroxydans lithotrophicus]ADE12106.1 cytochrome c class I [Sideroxydans lithotrophicus ES-1]